MTAHTIKLGKQGSQLKLAYQENSEFLVSNPPIAVYLQVVINQIRESI